MRISIVGATGFIGAAILDEAVRRGVQVTAISRTPAETEKDGVRGVSADTQTPDHLAKALAGSDAAVVSVRWNNNKIDDLLAALRKAGVPRALFVVGAGSLRMPDGRLWLDHMIEDGTAPPTSRSALEALDTLRGVTDLHWVAVSPSADIEPGERTGRFRLGGDERLTDAEGQSRISTQDFAMAILDEIEQPRRNRERFTVGY